MIVTVDLLLPRKRATTTNPAPGGLPKQRISGEAQQLGRIRRYANWLKAESTRQG